MPRACLVCLDPKKAKLAAEGVAAGMSDRAIAVRLGGCSHASVRRHRVNHIERPMRAVLQAANKGRGTREEREQLVAAAEQGDIGAAFLGIVEITKDLKILRDRLERVAADAEMDDQRLAVVSASSAQLRAAEVRAKLSGVGGYATPRSDKPIGAPFVLNINFSGGRTTRIEGTPMHPDDPAFNALPTMPLSIEGPQGGSSEDEAMFDEDV